MSLIPIVQCSGNNKFDVGFTLLEVLLVITISSFLCIGFLSFFMDGMKLYHNLTSRSEVTHQLLTGIEAASESLQNADPSSIQFMGTVGEEGYSEVQFKKYHSPDLYWYYLNSEGKIIQAVKRPDEEWGRNSVAEGIDSLFFSSNGNLSGVPLICLRIRGWSCGHLLDFSTYISPGFL